ncbi:glycosyltransferase family 4 protein [Dyadobacter sp. CY107]|uniref:glycosyltransferase family 4 protein n=1 Tax=Dyadobacter fanqingshengii TaxID=2906443 RepID=UPI001F47F388|nr:glycosyltransferase family 4 protein [Dyadobacter fanqingshengii]MCF2505387.1 glycosyltransferase family 4 protein [Dyadobacter fanqingshengii]
MEILFVSHKFPPSVGGMEKQSFELVTGMERYCRVHRIVFEGKGSILMFFLGLKREILRTCKAHPNITVIHFNDALLATICLHHKGYEHLKRTVTLHGLDVVFPSEFYRKRIFPKFNKFDLFIAVSRATADRAIGLGINPDKIIVINNGVDNEPLHLNQHSQSTREVLGKYAVPTDRPLLVAVGRPVKRKGFSWFIREVVPRLDPRFFVLLIGPFDNHPGFFERLLSLVPGKLRERIMLFLGFGSDAASIRSLLADHQFNKSVKHLGRLSYEDKTMILQSSDAFIMPNIHVDGDMEGFGLVCLEASMAGALVFAADIDGIPDAIRNGKNGFLLPSQDAEVWAAKLNQLIANKEIVNNNREAFRAFTIANYSWDKMVKAYYSALCE